MTICVVWIDRHERLLVVYWLHQMRKSFGVMRLTPLTLRKNIMFDLFYALSVIGVVALVLGVATFIGETYFEDN